MDKSIPLRRRIRAKAITALLKLFACFSLKTLYRFANIIASLLIILPNQTKEIAKQNIALAFPELSASEQQKLLHQTLRHNAATMFELSFMWLNSYEKILQSVTNITLPPEFIEDQKKFSQMIFITPHFGSWELSGLYASS
ncbi:lysophospholipid acyltransferase family protein, partial [Wohlfahrtiimonas larvae]